MGRRSYLDLSRGSSLTLRLYQLPASRSCCSWLPPSELSTLRHRLQHHLLVCILCLPFTGCALTDNSDVRNYETISAGPKRDTKKAIKQNDLAIAALKRGDFPQARIEADKALIANVDYAPAHNTLGRVLYCQKNYYLAAWEFEFAIRLQPEIPEYHNNLGLVYEAVGKLDLAVSEYRLAMNLKPDDFNYVSNLARVRIRKGDRDSETRGLLEKVALMDTRKEWKNWAGLLLNTTHLDIPSGHSELSLSSGHEFEFPETTGLIQNVGETPVIDSGSPLNPQPFPINDAPPEDDWKPLDIPPALGPSPFESAKPQLGDPLLF